MFGTDTDKDWEKFGKQNPYFGVYSHEKFDIANLTSTDIDDFFQSGYEHINQVLNKVRINIDRDFTIRKALDFGCGVGRLVIPLAAVSQKVVGIDVSESMLSEARKNCAERNIINANFLVSDDSLSLLNEKYNLIHSYIVFQHIPTNRGEKIIENLLQYLEENGVLVIHITFESTMNKLRKLISLIKSVVPLASNITNLIKGKKFFDPQMQMNHYNLNRLFFLLYMNGMSNIHMEYTNHNGHIGIILYSKKAVVST